MSYLRVPYAPTLEGQYIIKNAVLISAAIVLSATVRGGGLISEPDQIPAELCLTLAEAEKRSNEARFAHQCVFACSLA